MPRFSAREKSHFFSSFEKYIRAGMGMERACQSMLDLPGFTQAEQIVCRGILAGLESGETIGDSLKRGQPLLSDLEVEIISAAERGGFLEIGFGHLGQYFHRLHQTRRKILKGLIYPLILGHLAIPVSLFAMTMFARAMPDADTGSGFDLAKSGAVWVMMIYAVFVLIALVGVRLHRKARNSPAADRFLNRIPVIGAARRSLALSRFCEVFHIFLLAGLRMSEALEGAGRASQSGQIRAAAKSGANLIRNGNPLSEAVFGDPEAFPNDFARAIATAEESGQLDGEIARWAQFYTEDAGEAMERLAEWAPRVFYWFILVLVAVLFIKVGLAYFGLIEGWLNFMP